MKPAKSNSIGRNINAMRKQKGMTLKQLETQSGVSTSVLSRAERGENLPSITNIKAIATGLGCKTEDILCIRIP